MRVGWTWCVALSNDGIVCMYSYKRVEKNEDVQSRKGYCGRFLVIKGGNICVRELVRVIFQRSPLLKKGIWFGLIYNKTSV